MSPPQADPPVVEEIMDQRPEVRGPALSGINQKLAPPQAESGVNLPAVVLTKAGSQRFDKRTKGQDMSKGDVIPELKQILGAMIFAADGSLSVKEMHGCLAEVAETQGEETAAFARVRENDIRAALDELKADLEKLRSGFFLAEVAGGFRLQSDAACGKWLRHLLDTDRPSRLSRPALETLSIIAYRQPVARSEIEAVRGVSVDHVIKTLMEMQLVRIVGRSDLPGRPFLYGTTQSFLEHFGLRDLNELSDADPMLLAKRATEVSRRLRQPPSPPAGGYGGPRSSVHLRRIRGQPARAEPTREQR